MVKKLMVCIAMVTVIAGCKNTWNEDDKEAWRSACSENAMSWAGSEEKAKSYCDCVLEKMMQKYPNENDALQHIGELAADTSFRSCRPAGN